MVGSTDPKSTFIAVFLFFLVILHQELMPIEC